MAAALAMATAAVPIMAWCSLPMDRARTLRSMSAAATALPLEAVVLGLGADGHLRRVLARGGLGQSDQAHAHRAMGADGLEALQGPGRR
jgi:hypothetical protein